MCNGFIVHVASVVSTTVIMLDVLIVGLKVIGMVVIWLKMVVFDSDVIPLFRVVFLSKYFSK